MSSETPSLETTWTSFDDLKTATRMTIIKDVKDLHADTIETKSPPTTRKDIDPFARGTGPVFEGIHMIIATDARSRVAGVISFQVLSTKPPNNESGTNDIPDISIHNCEIRVKKEECGTYFSRWLIATAAKKLQEKRWRESIPPHREGPADAVTFIVSKKEAEEGLLDHYKGLVGGAHQVSEFAPMRVGTRENQQTIEAALFRTSIQNIIKRFKRDPSMREILGMGKKYRLIEKTQKGPSLIRDYSMAHYDPYTDPDEDDLDTEEWLARDPVHLPYYLARCGTSPWRTTPESF